ncbi:hypothetical protein CO100_01895, partial [Candidatus Berkelbacteria bacterium CG_4_9_14_3_um_filter_33_5]
MVKPTEANNIILPKIIKILKKYNISNNARIIDFGCGNSYIVTKLINLGYGNIDGIDINPQIPRTTPKKYYKYYQNLLISDITDNKLFKWKKGKFDLIISTEVIEHIFEIDKYLTNINRLLKKNGIIILSTPYHGYLKNLVITIFNLWDKHFHSDIKNGHIRFFSFPVINKMLLNNNLKIVQFIGVG